MFLYMGNLKIPAVERAVPPLFYICLFFAVSVCYAQPFAVSDPKLALKDNIVHITYDILNSSRSDKFLISIIISDPDGNTVQANALSGDIGDGVSGGSGKLIKWDLAADGIVMNSTIYVKINARLIPPPDSDFPVMNEPAVAPDRKENTASSDAGKEEIITNAETASKAGLKSISRGSVMLQSVALPGLGLSRITGKPHWIKGVAGYGCIAGSVLLNRKAIKSYEGIYDLTEYDDKDELLQKSLTQDNISETLAYVAIGIWVADLIWSWIGTGDLKEKPFLGDLKGLTLETNMDPLMRTPMIGVGYRF